MSALMQTPDSEVGLDGAVSDHKLVAAVRRGDDRAFESLYGRYHRRIHAYVFGMVKDHQRAEDVTQEVFVSALRRMRATERPIAFKPWIYEIAKNACIDQFRRSRRAEEVSYDADDGLAPSDYGRLVSHEPIPDAAIVAKQQLDHLCGAFGGLSDAHHQILVLRELEGLSYREIGERMGMSRPAVESTLFRARRRLTEEYDELASGQRCQRIQAIITSVGSTGRLGARDTRRLARHVAHCQPCRREALAAGVDAALVARQPVRRRIAEKVAALFPVPLLLRGRKAGPADSWLNQLVGASDSAAAGTAKLAAAAVVLVAGLGAGVQTHVGDAEPLRVPAADRSAPDSRSSDGTAAPSREARPSRATVAPADDSGDGGSEGRRGEDRLRGEAKDGTGRVRPAASAPRRQSPGEVAPARGAGGGVAGTGIGAGAGDGAVPQSVAEQAGGSGGGGNRAPRLAVPLPSVGSPPTSASVPAGGPIDPVAAVNETLAGAQATVGGVQQVAGGALGQVQKATTGEAATGLQVPLP